MLILKVATLSTKVTQARDFFVVNGPVQADRACYIRREADEALIETIAAQRFASVLAPRAMGKSSLMGRTIRRLRADGQLAAVVDLSQIGARGESVDAARWHYSIAYRISRELRIRIDLQAWWHDKNLLLAEQRLVEFFWDVVLANTSVPVTIFFDEAERAAELPFACELFAALYSCEMRRVSEPEFARLNFVVLGAVVPEQLSPDPAVSPFVGGRRIRLDDFTLEECAPLAEGFGQSDAVAELLLSRIHAWTHGQPYLTQKLARGVARRGGRPADVDAVLHELFLAPGIAHEEPLLSQIRRQLASGSPRARHARAILGRLARNLEVIEDPPAPAQQLLALAGLTSSDDNGMLRFRNRILEEVFGADFAAAQKPRRWQRTAARAAAAIAAIVLLPYWYLRVLPADAIETLQTTSDYALAERAHEQLGGLPGFGGLADRLLAAAMERRSLAASGLADVRAADGVLRQLPGQTANADRLFADYWLRQAEAAARRGERDSALLHALAAGDAGSDPAMALAANLIDGDYLKLEESFSLDAPALDFAVDWPGRQVVVVDAAHRVLRLPLESADGVGPRRSSPETRLVAPRLTALQQVGATRSFFVDAPGRAGALELSLTVEHGRSSDLLLRLRAPSGAAAEIEVPARNGRVEQFLFTASLQNGLLRLADESITGEWQLTLFDRLSGESGRLIRWGLRFSGVQRPFNDVPADGLSLPDPVRTEQVEVSLSRNGQLAVVIPSRVDARGAASVWDLRRGERVADLPLTEIPETVLLIADARLLVVGTDRATLWDTTASRPVAVLAAGNGFSAAPAVSPGGRFLALAEPYRDGAQISLIGVADGALISRFETDSWLDWSLAPGGSWLAFVDGSLRGRVIEPVTGATTAEFFHERPLTRVFAGANADQILAVDSGGDIVSWELGPKGGTLSTRDSQRLGATAAVDSLALASGGGAIAFLDAGGVVSVVDPVDGLRQATLEHRESGRLRMQLSPAGDALVTLGESELRYWQLSAGAIRGPDFGPVSAIALDAGGELALLGYRAGQVRLLPELPAAAASGRASALVTGHRGFVTRLVLSANGEFAASGGSEGVVRVWNARTGERSPFVLRHPAGPITALAIAADQGLVVSAGPDSVRVFALASGELIREIGIEGRPQVIALSADGRQLAIGDSVGNIYLTAPIVTAGVQTLRGRAAITALAFADAEPLLASGDSEGSLVIWDTLAAGAVEPERRFPGRIGWIALAPEGQMLWLQSGAWLHRFGRGAASSTEPVARLLPDRLRLAPALALLGDGRVRGIAFEGGGQLAVADISLDRHADAARPPERDWRRVLGQSLDTATGTIQSLGP